MHQHEDLAGRLSIKLALLQPHADGKRVARSSEMIAQHAIERSDDGPTARPCQRQVQHRSEGAKRQVQALADHLCDPPDASVNKACDAGGGTTGSDARDAGSAGDVAVHGLDEVRHTHNSVNRQTAGASQLICGALS